MSWRFVFNGQVEFGVPRDLNVAVKMAVAFGYHFISWNADVYFIDAQGAYHETGIKSEDLI